MLLHLLEEKVCRPSVLVGCVRQNLWTGMRWRGVRGDTILSILGEKVSIETPMGPFEIYHREGYLLTFRGGSTKPWWKDDIRLTLALVAEYSRLTLHGAVLFVEHDGTLREEVLTGPEPEEGHRLVAAAREQYHTEGRIGKGSPRALASCRYCPVRYRCDALDLERGEQGDWPKTWLELRNLPRR